MIGFPDSATQGSQHASVPSCASVEVGAAVTSQLEQHSPSNANAAIEIITKPTDATITGSSRPWRRSPGMNALAASKEQTPTMILWNELSAKKLKPIAGRNPTIKGIAAQ